MRIAPISPAARRPAQATMTNSSPQVQPRFGLHPIAQHEFNIGCNFLRGYRPGDTDDTLQTAAEKFKEVLRTDPFDGKTKNNLAVASALLRRTGKDTHRAEHDAIVNSREAAQEEGSDIARLNQAIIYLDRYSIREGYPLLQALQPAFKKAAAENKPGSWVYYHNAAVLNSRYGFQVEDPPETPINRLLGTLTSVISTVLGKGNPAPRELHSPRGSDSERLFEKARTISQAGSTHDKIYGLSADRTQYHFLYFDDDGTVRTIG